MHPIWFSYSSANSRLKIPRGVTTFFNGTSWVDCGNTSNFDNNLTKCTWHIWFYPTVWTYQRILFAKNTSLARKYDVRYGYSGAVNISLRAGTGGTTSALMYTAPGGMAINQWNHLVIVYDGDGVGNDGRLKAYTAGKLLSASFHTTNPVSSTMGPADNQPMEIGATAGGAALLPSTYIADYAIWTGRAATQAQVAELYNVGELLDLNGSSLGQPTHWWKMGDDATYPIIPDDGVGGTNPGTMNNFSRDTCWVDDEPSNPYTFTHEYSTWFTGSDGGTLQYIDWTDTDVLDGQGNASVALWFFRSGALPTGVETLVGRGTETQRQFELQLEPTGAIRAQVGITTTTSASFLSDDNLFIADSWNMLAWTFDGDRGNVDKVNCYLNGARITGSLSGTFTQSTLTTPSSVGLTLGAGTSGTNPFGPGWIDEAAIWTGSSANAAQVRELWNDGQPFDIASSSMGQPVHWLRMGEYSTFPITPDRGSGDASGTLLNMTASVSMPDTKLSSYLIEDGTYGVTGTRYFAFPDATYDESGSLMMAMVQSTVHGASVPSYLYFRRSEDDGVTWGQRHTIDSRTDVGGPGVNNVRMCPELPDGTLITAYIDELSTREPARHLFIASSSDAGVTWTPSSRILPWENSTQVILSESNGVLTDYTSASWDSGTLNDVPLLPSGSVPLGSAIYFGNDYTFDGVRIELTTEGSGSHELVWEYYSTTGSWKPLSEVDDGSDGFTVSGSVEIKWDSGSIDDRDRLVFSGSEPQRYWVRARVTGSDASPVQQPIASRVWVRMPSNRRINTGDWLIDDDGKNLLLSVYTADYHADFEAWHVYTSRLLQMPVGTRHPVTERSIIYRPPAFNASAGSTPEEPSPGYLSRTNAGKREMLALVRDDQSGVAYNDAGSLANSSHREGWIYQVRSYDNGYTWPSRSFAMSGCGRPDWLETRDPGKLVMTTRDKRFNDTTVDPYTGRTIGHYGRPVMNVSYDYGETWTTGSLDYGLSPSGDEEAAGYMYGAVVSGGLNQDPESVDIIYSLDHLGDRTHNASIIHARRSMVGNSCYFDGVGSMRSPSNSNFDYATKVTWHTWFWTDKWFANDSLVAKNASLNRKYAVITTGTRQFNISVRAGDGGTTSCQLTTEPGRFSLSTWHHLMFVFDGTGATSEDRFRAYADGTWLSGTYASTPPSSTLGPPDNQPIEIGGRSTGLGPADSWYISEHAIWVGEAATAEQAAEIYNSGSLFNLSESSLEQPTHWWRMGRAGEVAWPIVPDMGTDGTADMEIFFLPRSGTFGGESPPYSGSRV